MLIKVTQEHIDSGVRGDCSKCPIALAISEQVNNRVGVSKGGIIIPYLYETFLETPPLAREFIEKFDAGKEVEPFVFNLEGVTVVEM